MYCLMLTAIDAHGEQATDSEILLACMNDKTN